MLKVRLLAHLALIYPEANHSEIADRLIAAMNIGEDAVEPVQHRNKWNEADIMMITYGNSIVRDGEKPLATTARLRP